MHIPRRNFFFLLLSFLILELKPVSVILSTLGQLFVRAVLRMKNRIASHPGPQGPYMAFLFAFKMTYGIL